MHHRIIWAIAAVVVLLAVPAHAVPDEAFTEAHFKYVESKRQEFLAPIRAKGQTPTATQDAEATCRALLWWKMANPGGEAKLTYAALVALRRAEVICGQKMRRAPPIAIETGNPPVTLVRGGGNDDGTKEAYEDFIRWHQVTLTNAPTMMSFVQAKLTEWGLFGPGKKLYDDVKKAEEAVREAIRSGGNTQSAYHDLDIARARLANAEAEEAKRAAEEYARAHPITVANAENILQFVRAQVFVWGFSDAAKKLYDDVKKAEDAVRDAIAGGRSTQSAYHDLDIARARLANAEAEEANRAALEYARAHPITANDPSTADYVRAQVFLWDFSDEGKKLYDDLARAKAELEGALHHGGNWQSADTAVKVAQARLDAAQAAAREKARQEWRAAHPGEPENWPASPAQIAAAGGDYRIGPTDPRIWSGRGGPGSYPVPLEELPPDKQAELRAWEDRTANGSVDPLAPPVPGAKPPKKSILENVLGNVSIGVSVEGRGSGSGRSGSTSPNAPNPPSGASAPPPQGGGQNQPPPQNPQPPSN